MKLISQTTSPEEALSNLREAVKKLLTQANCFFDKKQADGNDKWDQDLQKELFQNNIAAILGLVEMTARHLAKFGETDHGLRDAVEPLHSIDPNEDTFVNAMRAFSINFPQL